jgi:hypothetical protein
VTRPNPFAFRRVSGAVAFLAGLALVAAPAAAERISMRVEIYGTMGLHVLTLRTYVDEAGDRYGITADYATTGVAGLLVDEQTRAEAKGRLLPGSAQPETFRNETRRNGDEYRSRVEYRPDGAVEGGSTPPPEHPPPAELARGTVDNLTAYFRLERQLAAKKTCAMTVPVFDGRHRYDLVFSDAGTEALEPEGGQKLNTQAIVCLMRRHIRGVSDPEQEEGAHKGKLWYAALLPGDLMVPVRMQLETQIGTVDAYLAEVHGRGVDLQLMK